MNQTELEELEEYPTSVNEGKTYKYNYWKSKPVLEFDEVSAFSQNIENDLTNRNSYGRDVPIKLPQQMKWTEININDDISMEIVSQFLKKHYLVDTSGKFKLDYTKEFLKWAIGQDGILLAIVSEKNNALCGIISANFRIMTVFEAKKTFGVVNFLCSHPVYRKKKIAFILIDEIVRRIVARGVHQGCFTTERCIPTPTTTLRFYHRPLNYIKLSLYGFTDLEMDKMPDKKNPEKIQKKIGIKKEIPLNYFLMEYIHIKDVLKIYGLYINKYNIYCNYTQKELEHYLLNKNLVTSYVIKNKDGEIVDFVSYYKLDYFMDSTTEKISAGYLFLYSCDSLETSTFMTNALKLASYHDMDMFTVTDTMIISDCLFTHELSNGYDSDNDSYSKQYNHGFLKGSGKIHFNFFNWKCPELQPKQLSWTSF
jgi:glycylpeptide N-tetradecanoyltransferase